MCKKTSLFSFFLSLLFFRKYFNSLALSFLASICVYISFDKQACNHIRNLIITLFFVRFISVSGFSAKFIMLEEGGDNSIPRFYLRRESFKIHSFFTRLINKIKSGKDIQMLMLYGNMAFVSIFDPTANWTH